MATKSPRTRIELSGVATETVSRAPHSRLDGMIAGNYQGWQESSNQIVRRREVPMCAIPFIVNFGATFRQIDPSRPTDPPRRLGSFVAGMYDSFVIIESQGDSCCVQINFTPIGARLFLQLPLWELSNQSIGLDDLFGDQASRVVEALAQARDWDRRFDLLEELIFRRIGSTKPIRPEIQWAWGQLQETTCPVSIGALAKELGWSHKHLIAQFRDHLGATPKRLARVLRFERTIQQIGACNPLRWAEIAFGRGYFDQSHMIREFRELAGCTPEEYIGLQLSHGGVSAGPEQDAGNLSIR
jgi:AraC-like DNA-binding protein